MKHPASIYDILIFVTYPYVFHENKTLSPEVQTAGSDLCRKSYYRRPEFSSEIIEFLRSNIESIYDSAEIALYCDKIIKDCTSLKGPHSDAFLSEYVSAIMPQIDDTISAVRNIKKALVPPGRDQDTLIRIATQLNGLAEANKFFSDQYSIMYDYSIKGPSTKISTYSSGMLAPHHIPVKWVMADAIREALAATQPPGLAPDHFEQQLPLIESQSADTETSQQVPTILTDCIPTTLKNCVLI